MLAAVMNTDANPQVFYRFGGALPAGWPSYVERPADDRLLQYILDGAFCYVLSPRQTGKSSLIARTKDRLQAQGIRAAVLALAKIEATTPDQWYLGLLTLFQSQLELQVDTAIWWQEHVSQGPVQRFTIFLQEVVLDQISGQLVIFVDEIETALKLDFANSFFAAIRALYDARTTDSAFERLTFIMLGAAAPDDLVRDQQHSLFNFGHPVDLNDFTRQEAQVLRIGLDRAYPDKSSAVFDRIFYWTGGHPYLTQMLCASMLDIPPEWWNTDGVDSFVYKLLISGAPDSDANLQAVHDDVTKNRRRGKLLSLYRNVYKGRSIQANPRSLDQNHLRLSSLVRVEGGHLQTRNEIYRRVFDDKWIKKHTPVNWKGWIITFAAVLTLILVGGLFASNRAGFGGPVQARFIATSLNTTRRPDTRLDKEQYPTLAAPVPALTHTPIPATPSPAQTPASPTGTDTPVPTTATTPTLAATPTATLPPVVLRPISPLYPAKCRNPITFRWTGPLQANQIYRVRVRWNPSDAGTMYLPQSGQLTQPAWRAQIPERLTVGGEKRAVAGEIEWQVWINDALSGQTVNSSEWFKFYFDSLTGLPCP